MVIKIQSLDQLISNYILCCHTEGKSQKTIDWYFANLKRFNKYLKEHELYLPVTDLGISELRQFIFHLQNEVRRWENSAYINDTKGLSPISIHGYVRSIKAFWSWLLVEGYIPNNPMTRLKPPRIPKKIIPTFTQEQIQKLLNRLDLKTHRGFRDHIILLVFLDTGIRLSELISLDINKIDFGQSCFLVKGKGNKERMVPFGSQVRRALWQYITKLRPEPDTPQLGQLFLSDEGYPLKPRAVQIMISRLGRRTGVIGVRCSPHTFRHTFAKQYLLCGGDVFSLQRILGHTSLEVVKLYINLVAGDISAQHRKFSPVDNMGFPDTGRRLHWRNKHSI